MLGNILLGIIIIMFWSMFGSLALVLMGLLNDDDCPDFRFVNPIWVYHHYKVNYLGALLLSLMLNLICPFGSLWYWIKLVCTVGRKDVKIKKDKEYEELL